MAATQDETSAPNSGSIRERLIEAAVAVLAVDGPGEMKVRRITATAGVSTIAVYHHFGDLQSLLSEVVVRGYSILRAALLEAAASDADPEVQLFAMALCVREMAQRNPHLYDMMFGLSTRGTYRAAASTSSIEARRHFQDAYAVLLQACDSLVKSGRVETKDGEQIAAQLWSLVHGFVALEAAGHFDDYGDTVVRILAPMAVNQLVGIGNDRAHAARSAGAAIEWWESRDRRE